MDDLTKLTPDEGAYRAFRFLYKAIAGALPDGFGGMASEFFDLIIADPAAGRRDRFLMELARRLDALTEQERFDPNKLLDNDEVSAFLLHSIQIAIRTHGEHKVAALREVAVRGTIAPNAEEREPGYVVLGILDRLTDHHLIILKWKATPQQLYSLADVDRGVEGTFDRLLYGQPTHSDPSSLREPQQVSDFYGPKRYVERQTWQNFRLAHADLVAMGLLTPVYQQEAYVENRYQKTRETSEIAGYDVSELGNFIVSYTEQVD